jgi:hypothetical protein|tara:strand:+ start:1076 stop:1297 length:222 start_codon:yes stop_codon:yes gene_type:complete
MSKLEINILTNEEGTGAITFDKGLGVAANQTITANNINITGVATATSFIGDGSGLTNLPGVSAAKSIAISLIT